MSEDTASAIILGEAKMTIEEAIARIEAIIWQKNEDRIEPATVMLTKNDVVALNLAIMTLNKQKKINALTILYNEKLKGCMLDKYSRFELIKTYGASEILITLKED